jgi:hypothetical protein
MQSPHRYDVLDFDPTLVIIFDVDDEYVCQTNSVEKAKIIIQRLDSNGGTSEN